MHVASKLIPLCPSEVHSDTPDFGKPFPALLAEVRACPVLPTAASPRPGTHFLGLALPVVHLFCSGGGGVCPCQAGPSASGTHRDRRLQRENAGLWCGVVTGLLKGPWQSYSFIMLPPCLRVSRNHSSVTGCSAGQRRAIRIKEIR